MSRFSELSEQLAAKNAELQSFFASKKNAAGELDMTMAEVEQVRAKNAELTDLGKQVDALREAERIEAEAKKFEREPVNRVPFNNEAKTQSFTVSSGKTLGEHVIDSPEFKASRGRGFTVEIPGVDLKTTMTLSAGYAPEKQRVGVTIPSAQRQVRIFDVVPQITIGSNHDSVRFIRESTFTNNAAPTAEGSALGESALAYTEVSQPIETVGHFLPVTEQQLSDVDFVRGLIDSRLVFMQQLKEESQILTGDGNTPNLNGFLTAVSQAQAKGADSTPDAIYKALTTCRVTGDSNPNAIVLHPNDWQSIRLLTTAEGVYIWGSPSEAGPERIWGLPVIQSSAITENTALVGDFAGYSAVYRRAGVRVEAGFNSDDFTKLKQTIRCYSRLALVVYRAAAFCKVTGI